MTLNISGKNLDIGESLRGHAEARINGAVGKYFGGGFGGQVTLEREGSGFRSECTIHLDSGVVLRAEGTAQDALQSFEKAFDRVEKRLRRYKRRIRDYQHGRSDGEAVASYVLAAPSDEEDEIALDAHPAIVAEETAALRLLTVRGAVMEMDLADLPVLVFRNAGHGGVNVVYRRRDGNIGWIDPTLGTARDLPGR